MDKLAAGPLSIVERLPLHVHVIWRVPLIVLYSTSLYTNLIFVCELVRDVRAGGHRKLT